MAKWHPRLFQKQLDLYNCEKRLVLATGPRACVAKGTLVHTENGLAPIESLDGSLSVLDRTATVRQTTPAWKTETTDGIEIELETGMRITVGRDHKILASVNGIIDWWKVSDLTETTTSLPFVREYRNSTIPVGRVFRGSPETQIRQHQFDLARLGYLTKLEKNPWRLTVLPDRTWVRIASLTPVTGEFWDISVQDTHSYLVGGFPQHNCGKTYSLEHKILQHAWRFNARIGIISKTTRAGSLGVWPELTTTIYDEWLAAGICSDDAEFRWTKPPSVDAITKIRYAKLRNRLGGESELMLFPVERSEDAVEKLFSTQWSAIWISESHLYESRKLFDTARGQLRLAGVPFKDTRIFCDANPPETGVDHWLYDVFFRERELPESDFPDIWDDATKAAFKQHQQDMAVFQFALTDNTYLDPGLAASIRATYARNRTEYARFVLGEWLSTAGAYDVFANVWDENLHVVGDVSGPDPAEWEVMAASNGPHTIREGGDVLLVGGWDPGEVNHAFVVVQPYHNATGQLCFDVLDEVVKLSAPMSIETFTRECIKAMDAAEDFAGFDIQWKHYSDSSAERFRAAAATPGDVPTDDESTDAGIVAAVSKGAIELIGSAHIKKPGWQRRRANLVIQLLKERRIRVSANCHEVRRMFAKLRRDPTENAKMFLAPGQTVKHVWDALSYVIGSMLVEMMEDDVAKPTVKRKLISV